MTGTGVANRMVEQAFAGWLLRAFDVQTMEQVATFLQPENFRDPSYARVYEAALEVLQEHQRPPSKLSRKKSRSASRKAGPPPSAGDGRLIPSQAGPHESSPPEPPDPAKAAPTAEDVYRKLLKGSRWHEPVTAERLVDIEIQCPATVAPRDWARLIVEDAARRRVQQLSYRVEAAPQTHAPADQLEQVRNLLQATLVQLQLADSRVNGQQFNLRILDPAFDWRDALRRVEPAARAGTRAPLSDAEVLQAENTLIALCLQHPDVGKNVIVRGEVQAEDLRLPLHKGIYECMKALVHRDIAINSVSVFRELLSKAGARQDEDDQLTMAKSLAMLERMPLGSAEAARLTVLEYVTRATSEAAVSDMRSLPAKVELDTVAVTDQSLRRVTRATYAAAGVSLARNAGRPALPSTPARRPENKGPASATGR